MLSTPYIISTKCKFNIKGALTVKKANGTQTVAIYVRVDICLDIFRSRCCLIYQL
jgi:hypothetical protein